MITTIEAEKVGGLLLRLAHSQRREVYFVISEHEAAPSLTVISPPTVSRQRGELQFRRAVAYQRDKYPEEVA